ncbi:DUF2992 family protein [Lachnospiraceae bacterium LCP19S3_B12]
MDPKCMPSKINSRLRDKGIGTKAQQALKLQYEQNKEIIGSVCNGVLKIII